MWQQAPLRGVCSPSCCIHQSQLSLGAVLAEAGDSRLVELPVAPQGVGPIQVLLHQTRQSRGRDLTEAW